MEKALSLTPLQLYEVNKRFVKKYDMLYLGSEFCQNMFPSVEDVKYAKIMFDEKLVLSTPFFTDSKFKELETLLKEQLSYSRKIEIVINDLGVLYWLDKHYRKYVKIIAGRLFMSIFKNMPEQYLMNFFKEYNIKRVETDNEYLLERFYSDIKVSFHYPLSFVAVTRFCPFTKTINTTCKRICKNSFIKFSYHHMKHPLFLKENTYFLMRKNLVINDTISRLVYTPLRWK